MSGKSLRAVNAEFYCTSEYEKKIRALHLKEFSFDRLNLHEIDDKFWTSCV